MSSPALSKPQKKVSGLGWEWTSLVGEGMLSATEKKQGAKSWETSLEECE